MTSLVAQWWKSLPANAGGKGFGPSSGKIPHALEQRNPCTTTTEPARPRARDLQEEKSLQEVRTPQLESSSHSPQLEKAWAATKTQNKYIKIKSCVPLNEFKETLAYAYPLSSPACRHEITLPASYSRVQQSMCLWLKCRIPHQDKGVQCPRPHVYRNNKIFKMSTWYFIYINFFKKNVCQ